MKEDFLHYLWQFKKFDIANLKTTKGESVQILNSGQYLQTEGPDFFNAQLVIENQKWAGNVEIHLKSSDWYIHHHEMDSNYDSIILHVVWEYDVPIFDCNNVEIPTLELKNFVSCTDLKKYQTLISTKTWINCENEIKLVESFVLKNWQERLFFERLERKSAEIATLLTATDSDWEAVLFCLLAKNFGLNTNGALFLQMANSIPFSVIRKESFVVANLEALFFGQANMLVPSFQDNYSKKLQLDYDYLAQKYGLKTSVFDKVSFFKHRPDNFPTIRLAQLAALYNKEQNLFSKILDVTSISEIYKFFKVDVSDYWQWHYNFDKSSVRKKKNMSNTFIDLIIINTIIPVRFAYEQSLQKEGIQEIMELIMSIPPEKNVIVEKFSDFKLFSNNAFETQSLLQLKNEYCDNKKCLQCAIGTFLLKN